MTTTQRTPPSRGSTRLVAFALAVGLLGPLSPASAQTATPTPTPTPVKTETQIIGNWKLTCTEFSDPKTPRQCIIGLEARAKTNNQAVFAWTIGLDKNGNLVSRMVTLPGVSIPPGVDLKIGNAAIRKLMYSTCEPTFCSLEAPIDAAFRKELTGSDKATVVVYGSTGKNMTIELAIGGGDKALAVMKK
ncbi:MAG: invasion associated locus B family protein [Siculibacillus sp.]|nr:invasion associated locus B family protein [Siculibacillus sp.]